MSNTEINLPFLPAAFDDALKKSDMLTPQIILDFLPVVFDHALEKSGLSNKVASWMKEDPQKLAFKIALTRAYNTFAHKHPSWAATLFDEHFIKNSGTPLLLRCLLPADAPDGKELATAWADHLSGNKTNHQQRIAQATPIASEFLHEFNKQLRARPEFYDLFHSSDIRTIAEASSKTAEGIEELRAELKQVLGELSRERKRLKITPLRLQQGTIINQQDTEASPALDRHSFDAVSPPIGAISGTFYVRRDADTQFKRLILQKSPPIIIRGARQTGKSSLLAQGILHAREHNLNVVHLDLQAVGQRSLQVYDHFLHYLAEAIVSELGLDLNLVEKTWSSRYSIPQDKLSKLLRRDILPKSDKPIILALDEVDYLLKFDFRTDFFGLLRSWHNRGATKPLWKKLNMVLVISTEPHLLIDDPYQSPFNVGQNIYLKDFSKEQLRDLAQRYRLSLQESEISQLMDLLNGHPYLTHQALYTLATKSCSWVELADLAMSDNGLFASHLRRYYSLLRTKSDLKTALKQVIHKQSCPKEAFDRLKPAGLVTGSHKQATFRCDLYQKYFEEAL